MAGIETDDRGSIIHRIWLHPIRSIGDVRRSDPPPVSTEEHAVSLRILAQSPAVIWASPEYLKRTRTPPHARWPRSTYVPGLVVERDVHDEWQFAERGARERIKFTSRLTAHGDDLREVALAGCGLVRLLGCHVEDELRSGALVQVLPDWECLGGLPIVAIYRKARSTLSPVNAFGSPLARATTTMSPRCVP